MGDGPFSRPFVAAMIVPTGVGASIGGFAGDATPAMNLLASVTDVLITHPNVANAAVFQKLPRNALYVEGYGLDRFMRGDWGLQPVRGNRVGVVFDAGIPSDMLTLHINTLNAVKSVYGVDIMGYTQTDTPVDITLEMSETGCSTGRVGNPAVVLSACRRLLDSGATVIALAMRLPTPPDEETEHDYKQGSGVDPIGGIEAVLSHLVVSELGIPCAHAPVFDWETACPVTDAILDPRTAAEFIAPTFLPCVLTGLARAPQFTAIAETLIPVKAGIHWPMEGRRASCRPDGTLTIADLAALVTPADALGGVPVLSALARGIPIIAVESNRTVLNVDAACYDSLPPKKRTLIRPACSYEEAAGMLQALRIGLTLEKTPI